MSAPAIIYIVIASLGLLGAAYMHGKPKEGTYNFWISLVGTLITVGLLFWGGFFK